VHVTNLVVHVRVPWIIGTTKRPAVHLKCHSLQSAEVGHHAEEVSVSDCCHDHVIKCHSLQSVEVGHYAKEVSISDCCHDCVITRHISVLVDN